MWGRGGVREPAGRTAVALQLGERGAKLLAHALLAARRLVPLLGVPVEQPLRAALLLLRRGRQLGRRARRLLAPRLV